MEHKTVLLEDLIDLLEVEIGRVYVDLTLGGGGHSQKILESLKKGSLIVFDLDNEAVKIFEEELLRRGLSRVENKNDRVAEFRNGDLSVFVINDNFIKLEEYIALLKIKNVNGVIADLGWSLDELSSIKGLSYEKVNDELDMRFDQNLGVKAKDLLNVFNKKELEKMFSEYANIYGSSNKSLTEEIIKYRSKQQISTVDDLLRIINRSFDFNKRSNRNSVYSKVFQALRIAVNQELINLDSMLKQSFKVISEKGKLLVITFHSGEEKIVESIFGELVESNQAEYITGKFNNNFNSPSVSELKENLKARSAKLFGIKKLH